MPAGMTIDWDFHLLLCPEGHSGECEQAGWADFGARGPPVFIAFVVPVWYHLLRCREEVIMLSAIEGTYRNGKIELREAPGCS